MSFTAAIDQIVSVIEATAPTGDANFGTKFKHHPTGDEGPDSRVPTRGFWWDVVDVSTNARANHGAASRTYASVDVFVNYEPTHDREKLLKVIVADYILLRAVLQLQSNWGQTASTIISLTRDGNEILFADVERRPSGARVLRFRIPLEFTEQTA